MTHLIRAMVLLLAATAAPTSVVAQAPPATEPLHGFVRQAASGEAVGYSSITLLQTGRTLSADRDGYFRAGGISAGAHRIRVSAIGYVPLDTVVATSRVPVELLLAPAPVGIEALTVEGRRLLGERDFDEPEVSVHMMTPAEARRVPAALEPDLFRAIQALPGVVTPSVLSSRLMVRGGAADQNLFLLDGYPVIYPYHLAAAFSAFHLDAVRDAEFIMGAPPARYGGRLSSVLDVALRDGNRERYTGAASLGLVTSSAVVEGPHPGGAWFVGARRTYIDQIGRSASSEVPYHFYDAYAKVYWDATPADRISALVFLGRDATWRKNERERDYFTWSNDVFGLSWRRLIGGRAIFEQRFSFSRYDQVLSGGVSSLQAATIGTRHETDLAVASGVLRFGSGRHDVRVGYAAERQQDAHRTTYAWGLAQNTAERATESSNTLYAAYAEDDVAITRELRVRLGLRAEQSGEHRSMQPRLAAKYLINEGLSVSAGYGMIRQYSHLMQDPDANVDIYNVDIWFTSHEPGVPVARSQHFMGGIDKLLPYAMRLRTEVYHKTFDGVHSISPYRPTEHVLAVERVQEATGAASGLDLSLAREAAGALRGWIGYSVARSRLDVDGERFPADPHPRHRFVAVGEAPLRGKWNMSGRFEMMEGVPFTAASSTTVWRQPDMSTGRFVDRCFGAAVLYNYGDRNAARTRPSKRLDLGVGRRWTDRRNWAWELSFSVLNALFDPSGTFRPKAAGSGLGCDVPAEVIRDYGITVPPIPSVAIRVEF